MKAPDHPWICQGCGKVDRFEGRSKDVYDGRTVLRTLIGWETIDGNDGGRRLLCLACAEKEFAGKEATTRRLGPNEPWPGAMQICANCEHRAGLTCANPKLRTNGGEGLELTVPEPRSIQWLSRSQFGRPIASTYQHYAHEPDCEGNPDGHKRKVIIPLPAPQK